MAALKPRALGPEPGRSTAGIRIGVGCVQLWGYPLPAIRSVAILKAEWRPIFKQIADPNFEDCRLPPARPVRCLKSLNLRFISSLKGCRHEEEQRLPKISISTHFLAARIEVAEDVAAGIVAAHRGCWGMLCSRYSICIPAPTRSANLRQISGSLKVE